MSARDNLAPVTRDYSHVNGAAAVGRALRKSSPSSAAAVAAICDCVVGTPSTTPRARTPGPSTAIQIRALSGRSCPWPFQSAGLLPPVAGALVQEAIDVVAVLNALRAAWPPRALTDF